MRIFNEVTGEEILRYDLGEDFSIETAVVFGELYKMVTNGNLMPLEAVIRVVWLLCATVMV